MNHEPDPTEARFPILDEEMLLSLPKSAKAQDMERIYTSPNSEDWVTWNILRALQGTERDGWWAGVVEAAQADAGPSARWASLERPPTVDLWRSVNTPPEYEGASRSRMRVSNNLEWRQRAANPRPVEGRTEVDLVFEGDDYLVFVEAKLQSDISQGTTYDPDRNQIARNIDCLIEEAGDREPFFWMFVRDRLPTRRYEAVIDMYRLKSASLHHLLPHRDPELLDRIVESIAIVTWDDLVSLVNDDETDAAVLAEIRRRISPNESTPTPAPPPSPAFQRLKTILPGASWSAIESDLPTSELCQQAAETINVERLRRRTVGEIVHGMEILGHSGPDPATVPTLIQWRLLPWLPGTWSDIADVTAGEMLSWRGIGTRRVHTLIAHIACLILEAPGMPAIVDTPVSEIRTTDRETLLAVRQIAAWGAAIGHSDLVEAIIEASEGRSDTPLNALAALEAIDLETFAGTDLIDSWNPRSSARSLIESFDEREQMILGRRILIRDRSQRATLQELADLLDVTSARVHQLETRIVQQLNGALSRDGFRIVVRVVREIREDIGAACPLSEAPDIVKPDDDSLVDELISWYAGPYLIDGDWLVKKGATVAELVSHAFDRVETDGIADMSAVEDELIVAGVHPNRVHRLLDVTNLLQSRDERLFRLPRTAAGRATLQMRLSGRPMTFDELFALDPKIDNIQSFRNALHSASGIVTVGPRRVALAEWDQEAYPGVVEAMLGAIDVAGGSIVIDDLAHDLAERFGVSENSVKIHASMHPVFLSESGRVRRRPSDQPYEPDSNLEATKDCFVINGAWALRVPVDRDLLRGSGRQIPEAFALHLGIQPLASGYLEGSVRNIRTSWQQYPTIGSIRLNVLDLGLEEGDFVFLRRSTGSRIDFLGLRAVDLSAASDEGEICMLVGDVEPNNSRPWPLVVGEALGFGSAAALTAGFLKSRLSARGQADVLSAVEDLEDGALHRVN